MKHGQGRREPSKLKATQIEKYVRTAFSPSSIRSPGFGYRTTFQLLTYRYQNMNNRVVSEPDFDIFGQYTEGFDAYSSLRNGSHPASSSVQNGSYPASSSVQNGSLPASSSVQDGPYPASSSVQNGSHPFPETSNQEPPSTPSSVQ